MYLFVKIFMHGSDFTNDCLPPIEKEIRKVSLESFFFTLLYGVNRDLQKILIDKGYRVEMYYSD